MASSWMCRGKRFSKDYNNLYIPTDDSNILYFINIYSVKLKLPKKKVWSIFSCEAAVVSSSAGNTWGVLSSANQQRAARRTTAGLEVGGKEAGAFGKQNMAK